MNWNYYCMIICITLLKFSQCELSIYAYNNIELLGTGRQMRGQINVYESMLIGSHQHIGHQYMAVNIAGIPLHHATVDRYLELYIDQHLTWQQHIDHVVSKARAQLYCIQRLHLSAY